MEDTIFTKIISKEIPAEIVYEDEHTLAFLDINPKRKGHTLVVPKKYVRDIFELDEKTGTHLMKTVVLVSNAVKKATRSGGINLIVNNGKDSGQEVLHLHFHIIPRFKKTEFGRLPEETYSEGEMSAFGEKIRLAF